MAEIKYLTIHCSANYETQNVSAEQIRRVGVTRFGQPSYHFVIERNGNWERHLRDDQRGAHVGGHNTGNIGICYIGGLDKTGKSKDTRTIEQKTAMRTLIRTLQARYPGIVIRGHRDWPKVAKDCPCFDVENWIAAGMPIE